MQVAIKRSFERISFSQQFLLASTVILAAMFLAMGAWLGRQIEATAISRAALTASVYVESIVAAQIHDWSPGHSLGEPTRAAFDRIFKDGPLSRKVVSFKLWGPGGQIIYSNNHQQIGKAFGITDGLTGAFAGQMQAEISDLSDPDNPLERASWERLLEVYVPVRAGPAGQINAVMEFYHSMENVDREIFEARLKTWALLLICAGLTYAVLFGLIRRANDTIVDQRRDLGEQLARQKAMLKEVDAMRERLKQASAQMTAMNEQALRRTAADLHDGPAQELAFALLRLDDLKKNCGGVCTDGQSSRELDTIHGALRASLDELRGIAGGLGIPGIDQLDLTETLRRAIRNGESKVSSDIIAMIGDDLGNAALAVKITAYRLVQEALSNARRHAPGASVRVSARRDGDFAVIEIVDQGPGFDMSIATDRLGLALMRERISLVGGGFELDSAPGKGTGIRVRIPIREQEGDFNV